VNVPRYDYPSQFGGSLEAVLAELRQILLEGNYVLGPPVERFEQAFAAYCGCEHAVGVNSGTDALLLTLLALGIGLGDEVITQANTFYATVAAIRLAGATPVLVDVDEHHYGMAVEHVRGAISPRTAAVIVVHLYGRSAPIAALKDVCDETGCHLIEDAAQAHGAVSHGRRVGSFGIAGCFSFHPSKNLAAAGDGGAVVTSSDALASRLKVLRSLGQASQNEHVALGFNSKLDSIQAAVLAAKLPHLDKWNAQRRRVAERYRAALAHLPLTFQDGGAEGEHAYHLFTVRTKHRDRLLARLIGDGVDAVVRYPQPIHLQPAFRDDFHQSRHPVAEALADELLCLPIRPNLTTSEIDYVAASVDRFFTYGGYDG
jgi:dTDP-4-amino-4,6-dideoxygalactose transaminase